MIQIKNESEFYELIKEDKIVVDFYADWCNPCKIIDLILQDIDDIKIVKVDIDRFRNIAKEYKVMSIPAIKIFSNGKVVKEKTGIMTRDELSNFIED